MRSMHPFNSVAFSVAIVFLLGVSLTGCAPSEPPAPVYQPEILPLPEQLATYEEMSIPEDNPMTPEKVALGRQLFFDKRLSADGSRSCYSCHLCENGLTDGLPTAIGALNKKLSRSSPTLWNVGYHSEFYWDGRSGSLEKQGMAAWKGGNMGADAEVVTTKINAVSGYRPQFQSVFGGEATPERIIQAIAAFERTIISGNTPFDRWRAGDETAVGEEAKRGYEVFKKLECDNCHDGVLLADLQYHNVGIGMDAEKPDVGRFKVTGKAEDTGAFKTPTLRDIAKSGPYFHNGSVATLEEAVDLMIGGGKPNKYLDRKNLKKKKATEAEKKDVIAFLESLTNDCQLTEPKLPE